MRCGKAALPAAKQAARSNAYRGTGALTAKSASQAGTVESQPFGAAPGAANARPQQSLLSQILSLPARKAASGNPQSCPEPSLGRKQRFRRPYLLSRGAADKDCE